MTHNLEATVFVYRNHKDKTIKAEYIYRARLLEDSPDWEHIATLEPCMWIECHYAEIEALAQPEQEPVAWLWELTGEVTTDPDRADGMWLPLYTTPPQRKPLTDDQIVAIYGNDMMNYRDGDYMRFARAIEAAHNIGVDK